VPLANGYIELLAIADRDEAAASDLGRAVQARIDAVGDGLMGWAVRVEDVAPEAERLGIAVSGIAREGLRAQLAGLAEAMREPYLPFFIGRDRPAGSGTGMAIEWIELAGDRERLNEWLGADIGLPVRVVNGDPAVRAVGIGERELR
jgi:Glyoxalase-like domain